MKRIIMGLTLVLLSGCAHETTQLDREALLKIIDNSKAQPANIIVTPSAPAPIVNVTQNNNGQGLTPAEAEYQASIPYAQQPATSVCKSFPTYDINGKFTHNDVRCY